jgi:hypothetical protein
LIPTGEQSGLQTHTATGKRFIVRADEILTAFVELESAIRAAIEARTAQLFAKCVKRCGDGIC